MSSPRQRPARPWAACARAVLAVALCAGLAAPARGQEAGVDAAVVPGDDFFSYANGEWLKSTELPAGRQRWTAVQQLAALTRERVELLLADARSAPAGTGARKAADFRAAYLDEAAIEARGLAGLKPLFDDIGRVRDKAALARLLGRGLRADVDPMGLGVYDSRHVLGLAVQAGVRGSTAHEAILVQGGLGLPDREAYLGNDARQQAQRAQYQERITRLLALAGFEPAAQRALAVMALETALAASHATAAESAQDRNGETVWARADFARQAPGMDWPAFFTAAGLARQPAFVAWQPGALKGLAALVASQPLPAWRDYLRLHAMLRHAEVLPRAVAAPAAPREQLAFEATQAAFGETLGRLYVERHFPAEQKARLQAIAARVNEAFVARLERVNWLSPASKSLARAKLQQVYFGLGYPETWTDDSDVVIDPADALGNQRRLADRDYRHALARLTQKVDPRAWCIVPQRAGAVLLFHLHAYNFAAALLQPPKFDPAATDAANYGAIGAIVGHELSHFIDTLGADYDIEGRTRGWWSTEDRAGYQAAVQPLVAQFAAYEPLAGLHIDGQRSLTENLADLGGLAAAFDAYRGTLGSRAADPAFVRQQDRQFFIGFARAWRSKASDEGLRTQLATDNHAPDAFRVATVRNLDAWYEAFDVRPGQRLYLEPEARLRIW